VIHHGVYPEENIITSMNAAINILNDSSIEPLFRISIFHYLFGYIHPFYNGNGRLNRFISSYYLANVLEPIMGYRLSYTIKENINTYYKSFKLVNEEINKGDITPFIFTYLDFIKESAANLKNGLTERAHRLEVLNEQIASLSHGTDEKYSRLYYYLLQASLFSEIGISTKELLEYLDISRPTLQRRLDEIDKHDLLITEKRNSNKFYRLNLGTLEHARNAAGDAARDAAGKGSDLL
jgi:Fic family protein